MLISIVAVKPGMTKTSSAANRPVLVRQPSRRDELQDALLKAIEEEKIKR